ncbi:hypothetical protein DYB28_007764, partial [Aphanomyces astaci]
FSLKRCLKRLDALVVTPVSGLGGFMYFDEYRSMMSVEKNIFTAGGVIMISGIVHLLQESSSGSSSGDWSSGKH